MLTDPHVWKAEVVEVWEMGFRGFWKNPLQDRRVMLYLK